MLIIKNKIAKKIKNNIIKTQYFYNQQIKNLII